MTAPAGYPSAPAVVLYREEVQDDGARRIRRYERIKVLSDAGRKYATVALDYMEGENGEQINDIAARTIHADGKIIPFTGKPYKKVILDGKDGYRLQQIAFTLPEADPGSILEYTYSVHFDGDIEIPSWVLQDDLFIQREQFLWKEFTFNYAGPKGASVHPNLPPGATMERHFTGQPGVFINAKSWDAHSVGVIAKDVPPLPELDFMPPLDAIRYKVHFSYLYTEDPKDFWRVNGESWSNSLNEFLTPSALTKQSAETITQGAVSSSDKLRLIYAFLMSLENTDDTRARNKQENKMEGHKNIKSVSDVLELKRGNSFALTCVFLALARAAGFEAYMMRVPNRAIEFFSPDYLSFDQFDDVIAIVNVDGKEIFLDPGTRYCPFGHLAWQHTQVKGLRQTASGTGFGDTPAEDARLNLISRAATVRLAETDNVSGEMRITFTGSPALAYRQILLRSDEAEMRQRVKERIEGELPKSVQIEIREVQNARSYEKPLVVLATLTGTLGAQAGKRRVVPADLFTTRDEANFNPIERHLPTYFHYPAFVEDGFRLVLPPGKQLETLPESKKLQEPSLVYTFTATPMQDGFTIHRVLGIGSILFPTSAYPGLRNFFRKYQSADLETIVLKPAEGAAKSTAHVN